MKKLALMMTLILAVGMLTACQSRDTKLVETVPESSVMEETTAQEEAAQASMNAVLEELQNLLGQDDETAAGAFGGGEENWTEDKSYFIGRIYRIPLAEESVKAFTSYDNENKVASVSVYLAEGDRDVTEDEVNSWVQVLNEYTGDEASYDGTSSEAGSKNWKWEKDDTVVSLRWLGDMLSIDMVRAVGELQ